jgi:hypothetical protein
MDFESISQNLENTDTRHKKCSLILLANEKKN